MRVLEPPTSPPLSRIIAAALCCAANSADDSDSTRDTASLRALSSAAAAAASAAATSATSAAAAVSAAAAAVAVPAPWCGMLTKGSRDCPWSNRAASSAADMCAAVGRETESVLAVAGSVGPPPRPLKTRSTRVRADGADRTPAPIAPRTRAHAGEPVPCTGAPELGSCSHALCRSRSLAASSLLSSQPSLPNGSTASSVALSDRATLPSSSCASAVEPSCRLRSPDPVAGPYAVAELAVTLCSSVSKDGGSMTVSAVRSASARH
mmetsp:Transcript_9031/g.28554  ORF Transcript_9031/g.28554 Transcript_9031/m.28554 type:complete len:265 (-) Transcript_9031:584-1378(-)